MTNTQHIKTEKQQVCPERSRRVPALRFKEFDSDWSNDKVGSLGNFKGGGTPSTDNLEYWEGDIPWISSSDVNEDDVTRLNITRYLTEKAIAESATKIIPKNSVLFVSRVGVGKLAVSKEQLCTSQDFANLIPEKDSSYFIAYYFIARNKLLHQYSQGTSIKGFTTGDLKSIPINIPSLPEQLKIASFLSAVDEKIQQLTKKKALLEEYKRGVMQQLFSGQLRFKDENGNPYPDWEEKRLGEVFGVIRGKGISKDQLNDKGETKCILYGQLYTTYSEVVFNVVSRTDTNEGVLSMKGDLLVPSSTTTTGIDLANVTALNEEGVLLGGDISILRSKLDTNNVFYAYYLSNHKKYEIAAFAQGSTIVHLSYNHFKVMRIDIPVIEEQQKIATYLSSIDTKIEAVTHQITQTKTFKKGLLQQMFV